jgi:hypothetical protein
MARASPTASSSRAFGDRASAWRRRAFPSGAPRGFAGTGSNTIALAGARAEARSREARGPGSLFRFNALGSV